MQLEEWRGDLSGRTLIKDITKEGAVKNQNNFPSNIGLNLGHTPHSDLYCKESFYYFYFFTAPFSSL